MTFLGNTSVFYGGGQVGHPINLITSIRGKPPSTFVAPLGTISLDSTIPEAWMAVANPAGVYDWETITGGATGTVDSLTGNSGGSVPPTGGNINILGTGDISVSGNPATSTLTISSTSGPAFIWNSSAASPTALVPNNGYVANSGGAMVFTLPVACAFGQIIEIVGGSSTSWSITQNGGQSIKVDGSTSTVGGGGFVSSTAAWNNIKLLCTIANTQFTALVYTGNLTVI